MKVLIVEDELYAQVLLKKLLEKNFPDAEVSACVSTVRQGVEFLNNNKVDLIFMDIQLSDGISFDIFEQIKVDSYIIFTTAYERYAIKAFEQNSIGYLLKPIEEDKFKAAMFKFYRHLERQNKLLDIDRIVSGVQLPQAVEKKKQRFVIPYGEKYKIIETRDIAYFLSKDKYCYIITFKGEKYVCPDSLDKIINDIDADRFYRLNRSVIANSSSIRNIEKFFRGRLKISLTPDVAEDEVLVARERADEFLFWVQMHSQA